MNTPWVESPFFNEILSSKNLNSEYTNLAKDYNENGYVVIPNLIPHSLIEDVRLDMDNKGYNPKFEMKNQRDSVRIQDLWMYSEYVKKIACNPKILEILEMLYGREAVPFQTLNFRVGTQQRAHSDTIHFSSIPSKFMCGVWVALEDINSENGAVFYYPKSQNLPEYNFSHFIESPIDSSYDNYIEYEDFIEKIVTANQFEKKPFYAKKGDVLIWSSNIIHGGSKVINEKSTRYSQVTHYYFKDCIYYTPMLSNMVTNELFLRKDLFDIKNGEKIKQSFNGHTVNYVETGKKKFILNNRIRFRKLPKILRKLGFKI
jgi:ectoine hydroxylase-related dioxygenase (phytanoyl-CoA dioxygenase family)